MTRISGEPGPAPSVRPGGVFSARTGRRNKSAKDFAVLN